MGNSKKSKSRSAILKKYEKAYESCVRKTMKMHPRLSKKRPSSIKKKCLKKASKQLSGYLTSRKLSKSKRRKSRKSKKSRKSRRSKKVKKSKSSKKSKKRSLTKYQKFIKKHSGDPKFRNLSPGARMKAIAKLWKKE
jgi:hypothetical protein